MSFQQKAKIALLKRQQLKMAESAHAYVRGNTVQFYEWLRSDAVKGLLPVHAFEGETGSVSPVLESRQGHIDRKERSVYFEARFLS